MQATDIRGKKALVVEDEPDFARFLARALEAEGLSASVAHDGRVAFEMVTATPPDVITLDLQMPEETGLRFFRKLRSVAELSEIPVVVITGVTAGDPDMKALVRSFLEVENLTPPATYLEKPVSVKELRDAVAGAIAGQSRKV